MFCVSIHLLWMLGRFHVLSVADRVATNAHGQVFVWTDVVVDVLGRVETLSLTVSRTARLFCSSRPAFHSHQLCLRALTPSVLDTACSSVFDASCPGGRQVFSLWF